MRKGPLFLASKLSYEEIGCTRTAVLPLVEHGWVDASPLLTLDQLFDLLTKPEIAAVLPLPAGMRTAKKAELLEALRGQFTDSRCFGAWHPASDDCVYQVMIGTLCDRLKLMFFGNCRQDWTEFVLSDLGIFRYEQVELSAGSLGFQAREDVDCYLHLYQLRERFDTDNEADAVLAQLPAQVLDNPWLESRRARLLFQIGQQYERIGKPAEALAVYAGCSFPGARIRSIRVLEKTGESEAAYALALSAEQTPESEAERQQLTRIMPRLHRKLGLLKQAIHSVPALAQLPLLELELPQPDEPYSVEYLVARHLENQDARLFYVENTLFTSLFGLLCWTAIFAPVPGAFFHPFQTGPADLHSADFYRRREEYFAACLAQLDSDAYRDTIRMHAASKAGLQSPFVVWPVLSEELIELALACIPAAHLKVVFTRMLHDLRSNRAGFPDLIQFWPKEGRYRMIEVKAPNDRLQDNQIRWMEHCLLHGIPVSVCHVQWLEQAA